MSRFNISQKEYYQYEQIAQKIKKEISVYTNTPLNRIKWQDFYNLLKDKYKIIFYPDINFNGIAARVFAGSINSDGRNTVIAYNNTNQQPITRQHFTLVHEGVHFFCDLNKGKNINYISETVNQKIVQFRELNIEKRTETVTSLIMCSDYELSINIKNGKNIYELCQYFGMSKSAISYRIRNYLRFNLKIPDKRARTLAYAYCYPNNNIERAQFLNLLFRHWETIINFLENTYSLNEDIISNLLKSWNENVTTQSAFYQLRNLIDTLYTAYGSYCQNCGARCFYKRYCPICGNILHKSNESYNNLRKENKLKEIKINNKSIAIICPTCGFDNSQSNYLICPLCGTYLQNICTGVSLEKYSELVINHPNSYRVIDSWIANFGDLDQFNGAIPGQGIIKGVDQLIHDQDEEPYPHDNVQLLPGFARFCPQCGCISSFYLEDILTIDY